MQPVSSDSCRPTQRSGVFLVTVTGKTSAGTATSFRGEVLAPTAAMARLIARRVASDWCGIVNGKARAVRS